MEPFVQFFGRLHPMLLHAPIGLLIGLVALEAIAAVRRRPVPREVRTPLAWLVALGAAITATTGFVLGRSGDFAGDLVDIHRILGIGAAGVCVLAAIVQQRAGGKPAYFALLAVAAGGIVVAGHKGAGITHGENYLLEPFRPAARVDRGGAGATEKPGDAGADDHAKAGTAPGSEFALVVRPILVKRCYACHSTERHKGGLALDTPEAILRGGDFGPIVTAGHPDASEIVRRLRLELDDEDHMPPSSKPQPSAADVKAIEEWIKAGAQMDAGGASAAAPATGPSIAETAIGAPKAEEAPKGPRAPDAGALDALRAKLAHAAPIAQGSNLLAVDLSVAPAMSEAEAIALVAPLRENIAELNGARMKVGDALLAAAGKMPSLRKLDLSGTDVTGDGIKALAANTALEDVALTRTKIGDAGAAALGAIPSLKRVYLWNAGVTTEAGAALRAKLPGAYVDLGEIADAKPVEKETEVKLSSEAPPPGAPAPVAADALRPVNGVCPVSGKPVDPTYAVVYKGRVVGFCCRHCVAQFFEDPAKFEGKIQ